MARPDTTTTPTRSQESNPWSSREETRPDPSLQPAVAPTVDLPFESLASTPQADGDARATNQATGGNEGNENEQERRGEIREMDPLRAHERAPGFLRNIFSMRSVIRNPPTTLIVAHVTATTPRIVASVP